MFPIIWAKEVDVPSNGGSYLATSIYMYKIQLFNCLWKFLPVSPIF